MLKCVNVAQMQQMEGNNGKEGRKEGRNGQNEVNVETGNVNVHAMRGNGPKDPKTQRNVRFFGSLGGPTQACERESYLGYVF